MLKRILSLTPLLLIVGGLGCQGAHKGEVQTAADAAFMRAAAQGNEAEVAMGRVAVQRADNPAVKSFGERMIHDHGVLNTELLALANRKNIELPTSPNISQQMVMDRLKTKTGADFDKDYIKTMLDDHKADIKAYQHEINTGKDPDVVAYARDALPILEEHLALARQAAKQIGVSSD